MLRLFSVIFAVCALAALCPVASAQVAPTKFVRCAVATVEYPLVTVIAFASTNYQGLVEDDAAACSSLIETGYWMGVSKYTQWQESGYLMACTIDFNSNESANVFVVPGSLEGSTIAIRSCTLPAGSTGTVKWYS